MNHLSITMNPIHKTAEREATYAKLDANYCFLRNDGTPLCHVTPMSDYHEICDRNLVHKTNISGAKSMFSINGKVYAISTQNDSEKFVLSEVCPCPRLLSCTFDFATIISRDGNVSRSPLMTKFHVYSGNGRIIVRYITVHCGNYEFVSTRCFDMNFIDKFSINQVYRRSTKEGAELYITNHVWKYTLIKDVQFIDPKAPQEHSKSLQNEVMEFVKSSFIDPDHSFNEGYQRFSAECKHIFRDIIVNYPSYQNQARDNARQLIMQRRMSSLNILGNQANMPQQNVHSHIDMTKPKHDNPHHEPSKHDVNCCICTESISTRVALIPCGHASYCVECSNKIEQCAICKANIISRMPVYF